MVFADQIVIWQNNLVSELSDDGTARLNRAVQYIYGRGFAKHFWDTQRDANIEKRAVRYIEGVLTQPSQPFA